jgi:hypothetical protein
MSSSPSTRAVVIPIPAERIIRELSRSAHAGFFGQCEISISLSEEALKGVIFSTKRERKLRAGEGAEETNATELDTEREREVQTVVGDLRKKLLLRLDCIKIVGHFTDGHVKFCDVVDVSETAGTG